MTIETLVPTRRITQSAYIQTLLLEGGLEPGSRLAHVLADRPDHDLRTALAREDIGSRWLIPGPYSDPALQPGGGFIESSAELVLVLGDLARHVPYLRMAARALLPHGRLVCSQNLATAFDELGLRRTGVLTEDEWRTYVCTIDPGGFTPAFDHVEHYPIFAPA